MKIKYLALPWLLFTGYAQAATIYLCQDYSGGTFFTNGVCSQQKATVSQMFSVSDSLTFAQQVEVAKQKMVQVQQQSTQQAQASNEDKCKALHNVRLTIEARDTSMQWRPVEAINQDQQRMRGLRAELSRRHCPVQ